MYVRTRVLCTPILYSQYCISSRYVPHFVSFFSFFLHTPIYLCIALVGGDSLREGSCFGPFPADGRLPAPLLLCVAQCTGQPSFPARPGLFAAQIHTIPASCSRGHVSVALRCPLPPPPKQKNKTLTYKITHTNTHTHTHPHTNACFC